ncbi:MAG: 50S ribosomal protein L4, partial [Candidatus Thermoplasmatota archaeon]
QPYGASPLAGKRHVAVWIGKGRGMSRIPRLASGRGSFAPGTVGGRRAHPPKAEKIWYEKINKKEKQKALKSALSVTKDKELVIARGHKFNTKLTLPIVIENEFENLNTTKEVIEVFKKLDIYQDIERASEGTRIRAGKGKLRGRKYKVPKSALVIVSNLEKIRKGAKNLLGVDITTPKNLNTELLAPGGVAGRLTIISEKALQEVITKFG